jgi:segregation and condensation protein B
MTEPHDVLEALLFASDAPVEAALIQEVLELPSADDARALVQDLRTRFEDQDRVLQIIEAGGGFRLVTRPEVAPWLVKLARSKTKSRLSRPALETLAIVAYRQPVSRPEVDAARGVNSEGVLDNLLERRLVRIAGRKDSAGRPFLYETTREFLVAFGLRDLGDLPKVDGELVLVDPGAAGETAVGDADATDAADADPTDAARAAVDGAAVDESGAEVVDGDPAMADLTPADLVSAEEAIEVDAASAEAAGTAMVDVPGTPAAAASEAGVAGPPGAEPIERPVKTGDVTAATDSHQQDPGPEGTELAPRG